MESLRLENFLTIIECGSLTDASKKLYISQSALSQQIKQREDELGEALFIRNGRSLELTTAGKIYAEFAKETLSSMDKTKQTLNALKYGMNEYLRIGFCQSSMRDEVANITAQLMQRHQNIQVRVYFFFLEHMMELFNRGELDVVFSRRLPNNVDFQLNYDYINLSTDDVILVAKDAQILGERESIRFKDLDGLNFIIRFQHEKSFMRRCEQEGISANIRCTCGLSSFKGALISMGVGVAFFPTCCLDMIKNLGLKYYKVEDFNVKRANYMIYRKDKNSMAIENMLTIARELSQNY